MMVVFFPDCLVGLAALELAMATVATSMVIFEVVFELTRCSRRLTVSKTSWEI